MPVEFHKLRIAEIHDEIGGRARTLVLEVPESLGDAFRWLPGQHLKVRFDLDGEELLRAYSISSSPHSGDPRQITVKRHDNGHASKLICDQLSAGDEIEALPPSGEFCLEPDESLQRSHYFFGAGSGITPLFSMLRSVLIAEPRSTAHLLYSNRDGSSVIFRARLERLRDQFPDRFTIDYAFSQPSGDSPETPWRTGRIDAAMVGEFMALHPASGSDRHYYVSGPGGMNTTVRWALKKLDVPDDHISMENFDEKVTVDEPYTSVAARLTILMGGKTHEIPVAANQTLLDAARREGIDPPYSCQRGVCGACIGRLVSGTIHHHATAGLSARQIDGGLILTCQSVATTDEVTIDYG